jgi:hypothetical protein
MMRKIGPCGECGSRLGDRRRVRRCGHGSLSTSPARLLTIRRRLLASTPSSHLARRAPTPTSSARKAGWARRSAARSRLRRAMEIAVGGAGSAGRGGAGGGGSFVFDETTGQLLIATGRGGGAGANGGPGQTGTQGGSSGGTAGGGGVGGAVSPPLQDGSVLGAGSGGYSGGGGGGGGGRRWRRRRFIPVEPRDGSDHGRRREFRRRFGEHDPAHSHRTGTRDLGDDADRPSRARICGPSPKAPGISRLELDPTAVERFVLSRARGSRARTNLPGRVDAGARPR